MIKVLQVKKFPIFDIFTGIGWLNWTRILLQKDKITTLNGQVIKKELTTVTVQNLANTSRKHNQQVSHNVLQNNF